ncbi:hypothetical protein M0I44_005324 [Klebsiella pneumoniae]|nr:hypothetical protein [Klebsiella pneumoniae]EKV0319328.1 hypothetical protein [Klebsiella pneumoniae]EKV0319365.1 hypothetical protein [Klebsiella pneumoniae]
MTSKLTREKTQQIINAADAVISALAGTNDEVHKDDTDKMVRLWDDLSDRYAPPEVVRELARMALAAMDSEPVAWWTGPEPTPTGEIESIHDHETGSHSIPLYPLYRHAQPVLVVPSEASWEDVPEEITEDNMEVALAWADGFNQCRAAMLQAGNSPVIPDGYVMVPKEPTENMVIDGFESAPDEGFSEPEVWEEYQNMSGCQQAAHRARLCWAAMIAAAPKQENI